MVEEAPTLHLGEGWTGRAHATKIPAAYALFARTTQATDARPSPAPPAPRAARGDGPRAAAAPGGASASSHV